MVLVVTSRTLPNCIVRNLKAEALYIVHTRNYLADQFVQGSGAALRIRELLNFNYVCWLIAGQPVSRLPNLLQQVVIQGMDQLQALLSQAMRCSMDLQGDVLRSQ